MKQPTKNEYEFAHPYLWHLPTHTRYHLVDGKPMEPAEHSWEKSEKRPALSKSASTEYDKAAVAKMAGDLLKKRE